MKSTKSERPRRFVVPEWALSILAEHRAGQDVDKSLFGPDYQNNGLIFCQPNGAYYSPDRVGARVKELMLAVGLEGVSLHSLRHYLPFRTMSRSRTGLRFGSLIVGPITQSTRQFARHSLVPAETAQEGEKYAGGIVIGSSRQVGIARTLRVRPWELRERTALFSMIKADGRLFRATQS